MSDFQMLDTLLQEKLAHRFQNNKNEPSNPFYVTSEEVASLLGNNSFDDMINDNLPGLELLANLFHLNMLEKKALLIIAAPSFDSKYERVYAYLADDLTKKYPTLSLLASLLSGTGQERIEFLSHFASDSPLLTFRLIRFLDLHEGTSDAQRPIIIEESVKDFLLGHYHLDNRLQIFCNLLPPERKEKISSKATVFIQNVQNDLDGKNRFAIHLYGHSDLQKQTLASEIASSFEYGLLVVDMQLALEFFNTFSDLISLLYREALLSGSLLCFDKFDAFFEHEKHAINESLLFAGLDRFSWLTFFASQKQWKPANLPKSHLFLEFSFSAPRYPKSITLWETHLSEIGKELSAEVSPTLAQRFTFEEDEMKEVVQLLKTYRFFGKTIDHMAVYEACRQRILTGLEHLAQPIHSTNTMEDIVLPKEQKEQLGTIISHYRNQFGVFEEWGFKKYYRSQGIGVLFTGSAGTGKTMAASILANALELDLYRIELSQVVSKYIGETEKNLSRIFEAAAGSGVILFFDEADAIFGKRTEIKDAHDRYANIEVSYLLQKIEEYDGLVILASNFRKNIDQAFVRRMRFIVEFPFPDELMRELIWKKIFPGKAPLKGKIDFPYLAKNIKLSGAHIRNIALFAAFLAMDDSRKIEMKHILQGAKKELRKTGETLKVSDTNYNEQKMKRL